MTRKRQRDKDGSSTVRSPHIDDGENSKSHRHFKMFICLIYLINWFLIIFFPSDRYQTAISRADMLLFFTSGCSSRLSGTDDGATDSSLDESTESVVSASTKVHLRGMSCVHPHRVLLSSSKQ
eukprot:GHVU01197859.1.p1 GENE.GHVU01197859.1~~GHVU01197859.1.p1  ORF type:complete len:123 (+),score=3.68 GHVU01197859.1:462-830(+)